MNKQGDVNAKKVTESKVKIETGKIDVFLVACLSLTSLIIGILIGRNFD